VPLEQFGIGADEEYVMEDLLTGEKFHWRGARNFIALDPHHRPAHVFRVRRAIGREAGETVYL
jgi:starch synthase (maltosyl-transferring)